MSDQEQYLLEILNRNSARLEWIAKEEVRGALLGGGAADGRYEQERNRLIKQADEILGDLQKLCQRELEGHHENSDNPLP